MHTLKTLRKLLFPFSLIYGGVIIIRNKLFDWNIKAGRSFAMPIISIGNITVGGTGKTPLTEYIIRHFAESLNVMLLSRGYMRKTKGVVIANASSQASDIGDEPMQIMQKFEKLNVVVAEKRVEGIESAIANNLNPDLIVLDDAFQHRHLKPGLSLLVMDYNRPLWKDCMLPAGELREPASGKKRADIIVVSKCPKDISFEQAKEIKRRLKLNINQRIFFSTVSYGKPANLISEEKLSKKGLYNYTCLTVTGIANPSPFFDYLGTKTSIHKKLIFRDHHNFSSEDAATISDAFDKIKHDNGIIITTEKDAVRLKELEGLSNATQKAIYYLPITIKILFNKEDDFIQTLNHYVAKAKGNC